MLWSLSFSNLLLPNSQPLTLEDVKSTHDSLFYYTDGHKLSDAELQTDSGGTCCVTDVN